MVLPRRSERERGFYLLTLGCPKNEVDSDFIIQVLTRGGWRRLPSPKGAEVILVNTCAFIAPAVEESLDAILELADYCDGGSRLVICGCLVSRYGTRSLEALLPEVSRFVMFHEYPRLPKILEGLEVSGPAKPENPPPARRYSSTMKRGYVYLKIAEGCRGGCSYCTIPFIRGPLRSRSLEEVVEEASFFVGMGAKELVLVAQDTTAYGMDLYEERSLPRLLSALSELEGDFMIRVMYMHPEGVDGELIYSMASGKVQHYFDLTFQHVEERILVKMGRHAGDRRLRELVERIREAFPHASLRGTCMVGFPGEEEEDFRRLLDFVQDVRFDYLAVFTFYPEEGTRASLLPGRVDREVALERKRLLEEVQESISLERAKAMVGRRLRVLVEGVCEEDQDYLQARSYREAPEVDGLILIPRTGKIPLGSWQWVKVVGMEGLDLIAEPEKTIGTS
jgi:ribosomal protein S12 methylthiotransferase